jgi:hypothetical protein
MPLDLTPTQEANVSGTATRPIYLVELWHGGAQELFSTGGEVVYGGQTYQAGGASVASIEDSNSASVILPWSPKRLQEIQSGAFRRQPCIITYIPAAPDAEGIFTVADGILLIDGEIRSSRFAGDQVTVSVEHISNTTKFSPRHTIDQVTAFVIPPGTQITWQGEIYTLEAAD